MKWFCLAAMTLLCLFAVTSAHARDTFAPQTASEGLLQVGDLTQIPCNAPDSAPPAPQPAGAKAWPWTPPKPVAPVVAPCAPACAACAPVAACAPAACLPAACPAATGGTCACGCQSGGACTCGSAAGPLGLGHPVVSRLKAGHERRVARRQGRRSGGGAGCAACAACS
jgi:hypothetical protein